MGRFKPKKIHIEVLGPDVKPRIYIGPRPVDKRDGSLIRLTQEQYAELVNQPQEEWWYLVPEMGTEVSQNLFFRKAIVVGRYLNVKKPYGISFILGLLALKLAQALGL